MAYQPLTPDEMHRQTMAERAAKHAEETAGTLDRVDRGRRIMDLEAVLAAEADRLLERRRAAARADLA